MYEGEDLNTIDLLYESTTEEKNGVKVIVPVKNADKSAFITKIKEQLAYFETVHFDMTSDIYFINDMLTIYRDVDYQYSSIVTNKYLHLSLDNVYYPIDFAKLGISPILFPVALRFSLSDGIYPLPNRESIKYNSETKKIILNKIKEVANVLLEKYNNCYSEYKNVKDIHLLIKESNIGLILGNKSFNLTEIMEYATIVPNIPKLKGVNHLDILRLLKRDDLFYEYEIKYVINIKRKWKDIKNSSSSGSLSLDGLFKYNHVLFKNTITKATKEYINSLVLNQSYSNLKIIKKSRKLALGSKKQFTCCYYSLLGLKNIEKKHWREAIIEYNTMIDDLIESRLIFNLLTTEVPKEYIDRQKQNSKSNYFSRRNKEQGDVIVKLPVPLERYFYKRNYKYLADTWSIASISKRKALHVYIENSEKDKVDSLQLIVVCTKNKISTLTMSNREIKIIEAFNIHNIISFKKFMEGKTKPFKRLVTAYLINKLFEKYSGLYRTIENRSECLVDILPNVNDDILELYKYKSEYYYGRDDSLYESMLKVANEYGLFDTTIYHKYLNLKKFLESNSYIDSLIEVMMSSSFKSAEFKKIIIQMLKYKKVRMSINNYDLPAVIVKIEEVSMIKETLEEEEKHLSF